jgi:hypothetical protein
LSFDHASQNRAPVLAPGFGKRLQSHSSVSIVTIFAKRSLRARPYVQFRDERQEPRLSQQVADAQSVPDKIAAGFEVALAPQSTARFATDETVCSPISPPSADISSSSERRDVDGRAMLHQVGASFPQPETECRPSGLWQLILKSALARGAIPSMPLRAWSGPQAA